MSEYTKDIEDILKKDIDIFVEKVRDTNDSRCIDTDKALFAIRIRGLLSRISLNRLL